MSDDEYPTDEELARNNKKLFGDENVVQFPEKPKKDDTDSKEGIVKQVDKYFADALMGSKYVIINEKRLDHVVFMSKKDFTDMMAPEKMLITSSGPNGDVKAKFEPVSKLWLESKHRSYDFVVFDPRKPHHRDDKDYNLFRGFGIQPKKGQCYKTLQYIKNVLCSGNKEQYRWLMAWCAQMYQKPAEKPETAVAIQGEEEGTGKSFFPQILAKLLDGKEFGNAHKLYFTTSNSKMITGDFSGHLEHCILLHAEEAFRAESDREDSIIKNLISEDNLSINAKNIEAKLSKNYIRLILTGNPPHIVKAGRFARRFLVLKISSRYRLNTEYFKKLSDELNTGGYEALMYYFMHYPIHKFNLRVVLKTQALLDQKLESMKGEERFWYNMLQVGEVPIHGENQGKYYGGNLKEYLVIKYKLFTQFQRFMNRKQEKNRSDEISFGARFSKFFPIVNDKLEIVNDRDGRQMKYLKTDKVQEYNCYIIPPLHLCRQLFDAYIGQRCEWEFVEDWSDKSFGDA